MDTTNRVVCNCNEFKKQKAHIEDWMYDGYSLIGRISNHPHQNTFQSNIQRTSEIQWIDFESKTAETENTLYTLGRKL